jgi:hypothetical protein
VDKSSGTLPESSLTHFLLERLPTFRLFLQTSSMSPSRSIVIHQHYPPSTNPRYHGGCNIKSEVSETNHYHEELEKRVLLIAQLNLRDMKQLEEISVAKRICKHEIKESLMTDKEICLNIDSIKRDDEPLRLLSWTNRKRKKQFTKERNNLAMYRMELRNRLDTLLESERKVQGFVRERKVLVSKAESFINKWEWIKISQKKGICDKETEKLVFDMVTEILKSGKR